MSFAQCSKTHRTILPLDPKEQCHPERNKSELAGICEAKDPEFILKYCYCLTKIPDLWEDPLLVAEISL